jgi:SAM-dependent methyltransferase
MTQIIVKNVEKNLNACQVKKNSNPFGIAFSDFINGMHDASLIVRTNKGEDETMPVRYFFRSYDEMPEIEKLALNLCFGKILDIGAGTGCHSLVLQEKDFDVTAIDIQPSFVEIMKNRGVRKALTADIFKYNEGLYDTLLLLMNGIGLTGNLAGLSRFLAHAKKLLNKGGQILLDSCDLMYLHEEEDGTYRMNLNDGYHGEIVYEIEYKGLRGQPFNWLFVDFSTLTEIANEEGFKTELLAEGDLFSYLARLH